MEKLTILIRFFFICQQFFYLSCFFTIFCSVFYPSLHFDLTRPRGARDFSTLRLPLQATFLSFPGRLLAIGWRPQHQLNGYETMYLVFVLLPLSYEKTCIIHQIDPLTTSLSRSLPNGHYKRFRRLRTSSSVRSYQFLYASATANDDPSLTFTQ